VLSCDERISLSLLGFVAATARVRPRVSSVCDSTHRSACAADALKEEVGACSRHTLEKRRALQLAGGAGLGSKAPSTEIGVLLRAEVRVRRLKGGCLTEPCTG